MQSNLRNRQRRNNKDNHTLASLPGKILFLEEEIQRILIELGSDKFRSVPEASGERFIHLLESFDGFDIYHTVHFQLVRSTRSSSDQN